MPIALALFLLLQAAPSEAAKKARAELDQIRADVEKLMKLSERDQKLREQFRAGSDDEDRLKKLAKLLEDLEKEFKELNASTIKSMNALLASTTEALKAAPDDPGLLDVRAEAYLIYGKNDQALPDLEKLAPMRPDDAALTLKLARLEYSVNRFEKAAEAFEKASKSDAKNSELRLRLALCDLFIHKFDEAVALFDEVLKGEIDARTRAQAAQFQELARTCAPLWKAEQEIRAKEAAADDLPRVKLTTSKGEIELVLFENEAPNTVANFIELISAKFYDGLKFHRIIPEFMAQGGDPNGNGSGGPGYTFKDELQPGFRRHFRGSLAMANSGPDTNGSQFFINYIPTEWLNGKHTVFGRVTKGQEIADLLQPGDSIVKAEILRKRDHEYKATNKITAPAPKPDDK